MNLWGIGSFDNDAAVDWLFAFGDNDFRLIDRTLAGAAHLTDVDVLEVAEACEVLAAAECVAAACGVPSDILPDEILAWVEENSPMQVKPAYVVMSRQAVGRVLKQSELRDYWVAHERLQAWETAVSDLQHRLSQIP